MDLKASGWESCWACSLLLVFRIWLIPDLLEGEYGKLRVGSFCFPEHSAPFWLLLALPALQRDIPGLEGAGSTAVGSLAPGVSPIHSPHPSSLEPSVGMSPSVGDTGWDDLGQCLIWVGPAHVSPYWDVLGDLQHEWKLLLLLLE